jgi:ribosome-binding protein aMBF1 (putative translation factor)
MDSGLEGGAGAVEGSGAFGPAADAGGDRLPVMPGFREMALRRMAEEAAARAPDEPGIPMADGPGTPRADEPRTRMAQERVARMAEDRGRLVRELAEQRQAAGLSQTEVAARMGTSQSAVARLESGTADVRASTLERYAAAVGGQITWKLNRPEEGASR